MISYKIIKSLEESGLLIKDVTETIKNEAEKQKDKFLSMSLGTVESIYTVKAQLE